MTLPVNLLNIPPELTRVPQWVAWKLEERDGKPTKPPYNLKTAAYASVTDPATWSPFEAARVAWDLGSYSGMGFVLTPQDDFFAIDIDDCIDPVTGRIEARALALIDQVWSYTEVSPSGRGIRIFGRGTLPPGRRKKDKIEFYDCDRYLTVTGQPLSARLPKDVSEYLPETPRTLEERTAILAHAHAANFPASTNGAKLAPKPSTPVPLADQDVLKLMFAAQNGAKVRALWNGVWSDHPSPSEADLALCHHLAFGTGRDAARMDALFRQSGLMRAKWDARHYSDGRTYGQATIATACAGCAETYTPPRSATDEAAPAPASATSLLGTDLSEFLAQTFPPRVALIEGVLTDDGGGWLSGEEKLGKTYYALEEALCLAFGWPVCGKFIVPARVKVLFIEEEDSPRRAHARLRALLRGHGLDPDDAAVRAELAGWFRIAVWTGFTFDEPPRVEQLRQTIAAFTPTVVYLDVLRKLTAKDMNKAEFAGPFLALLDELRRTYQVLLRILAHNRKIQGSHRAGRGSQELAGSYQLGAWAENSLFFEPIGKKHGAIKIQTQCKDLPPQPAFTLRFESEGPEENPDFVRVMAEELKPASAGAEWKERVYDALASLPPDDTPVKSGTPGVSVIQIAEAIHCSDKTVRKALDLLIDEQRCLEIGKASKQKKLYGVKPL